MNIFSLFLGGAFLGQIFVFSVLRPCVTRRTRTPPEKNGFPNTYFGLFGGDASVTLGETARVAYRVADGRRDGCGQSCGGHGDDRHPYGVPDELSRHGQRFDVRARARSRSFRGTVTDGICDGGRREEYVFFL